MKINNEEDFEFNQDFGIEEGIRSPTMISKELNEKIFKY